DDLGLDPLRLAPLTPFGTAATRQQVCFIATLQIAIVVLAEGLRAGPVVAVEVPDPLEQLRPTGLHRLVFRDQKTPLLQIVAFYCPIVAVVAHRIVLQRGDPISELVNLHSNDVSGASSAVTPSCCAPDRACSVPGRSRPSACASCRSCAG